MSTYTTYFIEAMTDTAYSRCSAASSSVLHAKLATNPEAKRKFLNHSLAQLENARERILQELEQLT